MQTLTAKGENDIGPTLMQTLTAKGSARQWDIATSNQNQNPKNTRKMRPLNILPTDNRQFACQNTDIFRKSANFMSKYQYFHKIGKFHVKIPIFL